MDCEKAPNHWKCLRKRKSLSIKMLGLTKIIKKNVFLILGKGFLRLDMPNKNYVRAFYQLLQINGLTSPQVSVRQKGNHFYDKKEDC